MDTRVILAGLGGQGVVFLTRLLAQTAVALGHPIMVSETHGMSQRGGSVVSHLKIGGSNQAALIARGTADALLALDADEAVRRLPYLRQGGAVFVNSEDGLRAEVDEHVERRGIQVLSLPASRMALQLGSAAVTNVVLAGYAAAHSALPLPLESLRETLGVVAPRGLALNQQALDAGYQAGLTVTTH